MNSYRSKDYYKISGLMYLRLGANDISDDKKHEILQLVSKPENRDRVPWGGSQRVIPEIQAILNDKRKIEGIAPININELKVALELYLKGTREHPLVEELNDALSNLREYKFGVNKFSNILPLTDDLRRAS